MEQSSLSKEMFGVMFDKCQRMVCVVGAHFANSRRKTRDGQHQHVRHEFRHIQLGEVFPGDFGENSTENVIIEIFEDDVCPDPSSGPLHDREVAGGVKVQSAFLGPSERFLCDRSYHLTQNWVSRFGLDHPIGELQSSGKEFAPVWRVWVGLDPDDHADLRRVDVFWDPVGDRLQWQCIDISINSTLCKEY
ncbi:hypothetical protein OGATHE_005641 [Ogataea polymorpha]|uniref:Uncharacterized protein n=1 Tax=Ogataea polymorpha TaxID=460523 RepID=A0A9P8SYQ4_9ASCO|nr:hypothetical protein OGATHE_005641 [Ogataea polymorpha]